MKYLLSTCFISLLLGAGSADAGKITIPVVPSGIPEAAHANIELSADDAVKLGTKTGDVTLFSFPDPSKLSGVVTVAVNNPPTDFAKFELSVEVPFFWDFVQPQPLLAAALVKEHWNPVMVLGFLGTPYPRRMDGLILYYQQARLAWIYTNNRLANGQANETDLRVAERFVTVARDLAVWAYMVPDDVVYSAADFLRSAPQQPQFRRVLDAVRLQNDNDLLAQFDTAPQSKLQAMVDQISAGLARKSSFDVSCQRANILADFIDNLSPEAKPLTDANMRREMQNYTNVTLCTTRSLASATPTDAGLADRLDASQAVHDSMQTRLMSFQSHDGIRANADARSAELLAQINRLRPQVAVAQ
ncbi:hypothetical protein LGH82_30975 [Mesorhizobium sp. PAMC28654]|uniref:hypothetical protein n=1 Tax=Mesorhizobium sp. PAMC28654 TaxID=2880934 RepID=UPI001D0B5989|nr:hypothetical protein [Mesorhizobium sp. PAMC28654]UDL89432.1 hypothetical protein LGH82_30975 [Mesorhizobium sp. PAMC28654]